MLFAIVLFALFATQSFAQVSSAQAIFNKGITIGIRVNNIVLCIDNNGQLIDTQFDYRQDTDIDYYDHFDNAAKQGKVKQIGDITFDYYDNFDRDELRGRLKSINGVSITYYDTFDYSELKGKLKSVGDITISYYDRFDDKTLVGKLKSAGTLRITYFDSFDREKSGRIKSISGSTDAVFLYSFSKMN